MAHLCCRTEDPWRQGWVWEKDIIAKGYAWRLQTENYQDEPN